MKKAILALAFGIYVFVDHSAHANDLTWNKEVAGYANTFFKRKYQHAPGIKTESVIGGKSITVYRPNHGLAHGLRQGYLASDIVYGMKRLSLSGSPLSKKGQNFIAWIDTKLSTDAQFTKKLVFAASFQRTGRGSEISHTDNPVRYQKYKERDAKNLKFFATQQNHVGQGKLFEDDAELQLYMEALCPKHGVLPSQQTDLKYLSKIIKASHELDLRRSKNFSSIHIQSMVQRALFGAATLSAMEKNYLTNLWARSGEYLAATGDRDSAINKRDYSSCFYILSHDVNGMVEALHQARKNSAVKF